MTTDLSDTIDQTVDQLVNVPVNQSHQIAEQPVEEMSWQELVQGIPKQMQLTVSQPK